MKRTRLVLTQKTTEEDVAAIAGALGLSLFAFRPDGGHTYERIFATPDQTSALTYVEDRALGLRYIALTGPASAAIEDVLRRNVPLITPELVHPLFQHAQSREEWITAITHGAAVSNSDFDLAMFAAFEKVLRHPEIDVRKAAVFATSYPGWKEFQPLLQELSETDPSPDVRYMAARVIETMQERWSKGGQ